MALELPDQPAVGDIVLYRHSSGTDVPAIVLGHASDDIGEHLHVFTPPWLGVDTVDHQWGCAPAADLEHPALRTWRPKP